MNAGVFGRVLVAVEFEPADDAEVETDRAVEVGDHDWIAVSVWTVQALELAARLARGGELWVVHATADFRDHATLMSAASIAELNRGARHHATTVLETIANRHCPDVELHYVVAPGEALKVILEAAEQHPPDAIVLATSSRGRVHRTFLGSTADKVIRQSSRPVVVVPAGHQESRP